jgi:hypothetical protein
MEGLLVEKSGRKGYITGSNGRSSWERKGIFAFCTCQWNEIINVYWRMSVQNFEPISGFLLFF